MKKSFLLIIVTFLAFSCSVQHNAQQQADYLLFSFRKTQCRGVCPVYYMEIYKSGKATFEGLKNTEKMGLYQQQLSNETVEKLIAEFERCHFMDFNDEYITKTTDRPSTYISYNNSEKTKTVRDQSGAPDELKRLENQLEGIAENASWIKNK